MRTSELAQVLPALFTARLPVLLKSAPGVGKTSLGEQAAAEVGFDMIVSHPVVSDPTDFKGLPFAANGKAEFLPFGDLRAIVEAKKPTVYFLDDLGQAAPAVQAAAMQLILARRVNGHKVSDKVTFLAATNRKSDRAGVSGILEPVKSRFVTIIDVEANVDDWCAWAANAGLPEQMVAFIRYRPNLLNAFEPTADITNTPSPRTIHNVAKLLSARVPPQALHELIAGAAGKGFADEFLAFVASRASLVDPDKLLADPDSYVPNDQPAALYMLTVAIAYRAKAAVAANVFRVLDKLPVEFRVLGLRTMQTMKAEALATAPGARWMAANTGLLTV